MLNSVLSSFGFPLLAALALMVVGIAGWRVGVVAALVLAVVEGALRKWLLPDLGQWIYLAKDFLLIGAYAGFWGPRILNHRRLFVPHPASGLLALLGVLAVIHLANPSLPNLLVGLFGLKAYLLYVPLMYMVPAIFQDLQELERFWFYCVILAVMPLALGIVQFWAPPESILNRYAWEDELGAGVAGFTGLARARITGTFSYITGYTTYLTLIFLMAVSWTTSERRGRVRWMLYGVLGLVLGNLLMTGSRGPLLILGASLPVLLALTWHSGARARRRAIITACVALPLVSLLASNLFPEARTAFFERARRSEDLPDRLAGILYNPIWALGEAGLFGYGIGSTHQARAFLVPQERDDALTPPAEGEWERVILEVGPLGFGLVLLMRVFVARQLWRALRASRASPLQPYVTVALLFCLVSVPGNLVFNHTASIFYWFLAGFGLLAVGGVPSRVPSPARVPVPWNEELRRYAR